MSDIEDRTKEFTCNLSIRDQIGVLTIAGIVNNAAMKELVNLQKQISENNLQQLVFNLQEFNYITKDAYAAFIQFQADLRKNSIEIRICSLIKSQSTDLVTNGLMKEEELFKDLISAFQDIINKGKLQ